MSKADNGLPQTESEVLAEAISKPSCHVVLVPLPPADVKQVLKYLESSGKHDGRNEADSDSGDRLFLTQKCVPEAERPRRRRSIRSTHLSRNGDLIEDKDDSSSFFSDGESRSDKKKKVVYRLPTFSFPLLQERKSLQKNFLSAHRNKKLHHFEMGGFFKCVQEQKEWHKKRNLMASLSTIDRKGDYISPISESEEERTEAKDIQVVPRKRFVVSLKAKSLHPWYNPRETCSEEKLQTEGAQRQRMEEAAVRRLLSSCSKSCDEGDSSHGGREVGDTFRIQTETADSSLKRAKKKLSFVQSGNANQFSDVSDAAACETDSDKRIGENTEPFTESQSADAECEPEGPDLLQNATPDDSLCESTKKKKRKRRKKYKGVQEVNDLSLDEAEGQKAAECVKIVTEEEKGCLSHGKSESAGLKQNRQKVKSADHKIGPEVNVEKRKNKKKKQKRFDEQMQQHQTAAKPQIDNEEAEKQTLASDQTTAGPSEDLLRSSENVQAPLEALESSGKRKKHKKRRSAFNETQVEDFCKNMDFSKDLSSAENVGLSTKKETKKIHDSCPETQTITEQVVTKKKKKKREKQSKDTNAQCESAQKRDERRASCFLHPDQQEQVGPDESAEQPAGRTSDVTAESAEIIPSLEERDTGRKKKKRKRSAVQPSVNGDSEEPQEMCSSSPSVVMKKKKRKLTESSEVLPMQNHLSPKGLGRRRFQR